MRTVLTIAGSDGSAGAGIQADLKTIAANGGYGVCVLTSVTAQNTRGVSAAWPLPVDAVEAQCAAIFDDIAPAAVKSGALATRETVERVAACLRRYGAPHYVLDPVLLSSSGFPLLAADAVDALRDSLVPLAELVTPNVPEAELLAGVSIRSLEDAIDAGRRIRALGANAVLVKGGHLASKPATDVLVTADGVEVIPGEYIDTPHTHGTGCTYSAAIATQLAHGRPLREAVRVAKAYLTEAIRHGMALGSGSGPLDHFFYLRNGTADEWLARLVPTDATSASRPRATESFIVGMDDGRPGSPDDAPLVTESFTVGIRGSRPITPESTSS